ncbi:YncE family protein [Flaviflagellibacter deserti]|uniref:YncE family protein n=1 Tax=Flaviflagellibacter deserti TaxID=2267266 RepID=A0ABV9Z2M5_9HYPH
MNAKTKAGLAALLATACTVSPAIADDFFLASGRWDNTVIVIDLKKAIDPANDGTSKAVINRLRVTPDIDATGSGKADTVASGQPIIITISPELRRAFVVNHSGKSTPEQAGSFQHGWPGSVTVVDLDKALDTRNNGTLGAVEGYIDSEGFGATGFAVSPDLKFGVLAHAEDKGNEDGGRHINIVDLAQKKVVHKVEQAYGKPGFDCPPATIPHKAPDKAFGCFPDTNGVTISPLGGGTVFTANGGTNDVSVISLSKATAGEKGAEIGRIPTQSGGFGITTSPDGKYVLATAREDAATGVEGNTISIIDVEKAIKDPAKSEVARLLVGTANPEEATRPFVAAFTPDGKQILTTTFRSNNLTVHDAAKAIAGEKPEPKLVKLETPNGEPSRPRGIAFSSDGTYAAISGAPKSKPNSGVVWVIDTKTWEVKGRVTEIGNESYMIGAFTGTAK